MENTSRMSFISILWSLANFLISSLCPINIFSKCFKDFTFPISLLPLYNTYYHFPAIYFRTSYLLTFIRGIHLSSIQSQITHLQVLNTSLCHCSQCSFGTYIHIFQQPVNVNNSLFPTYDFIKSSAHRNKFTFSYYDRINLSRICHLHHFLSLSKKHCFV